MKIKVSVLLCMVLFLLCSFSMAEESERISTNGDYSFVLLANDTVEITKYNGNVTNLIIPDVLDGFTVSRIGNEAFYYCTDLKTVNIPNSVTSIGADAFSLCVNLRSVIIPDSVTSIGNSAFDRCENIETVMIPTSVTSIGDGAFSGCYSLTNITIPDSFV